MDTDPREDEVAMACERVKAELGCSHAILITFWDAPDGVQMVDAGEAPISLARLYARLAHHYIEARLGGPRLQ